MNRSIIFFSTFFLFAFTLPAESFSPGVASVDLIVDLHKKSTKEKLLVANDVVAEPVVIKTVEVFFEDYVKESFDQMDLRGTGLKLSVYRKALIGYQNLKHNKALSPYKSIITIADLTKSSRQKRLWVIDLKNKKLLYHSLVAHGQGSGGDMAVSFSNSPNSFQSSVGFYVTANTYHGKHGLSLKLSGRDAKYNSNAMRRAIVIHGADYVSKDYIRRQGRLGRSQGCPALPAELNNKIIKIIKDRTCLYIEGGLQKYSSVYLNKAIAVNQFATENKAEIAKL